MNDQTPGRAPICASVHGMQIGPAPVRSRPLTTAVRGGAQAKTGLELLAVQMSEAQLQNGIIARCDRLGLLSYHTHDSRRSKAGFMDLVIVGPYGGLFWECKSETGKTSPEQDAWLDMMTAAGFSAAVRRPSHLLSGQVDQELLAISRHGKRAVT